MSIDILPGHSGVTTLPERWFGVVAGESIAMMHMSVAAGSESAARWLPVATYEAILTALVIENDLRAVPWEPDTPEQAANRAEITEALLDDQAAVMARGGND